MKRNLSIALSVVLLSSLVGCGENIKDIDEYINGNPINLEAITLITEDNSFELRTDIYENNKNITIYKYKLVNEPSKPVYSTVYNRRIDDTEETIFELFETMEGSADRNTVECYFVKEAGEISIDVSFNLYEESNMLEIEFTNINKSLTQEDYNNYLKQNKRHDEIYQKELIYSLFANYEKIHLSNTISFYLDLNNYTQILYIEKLSGNEINKSIIPCERKGKVSMDYFFTYKDYNIEYILGGKFNKLDLARYELNGDIKHIPYESSISLPNIMQINDEEYTQTNSYCGRVLLEVNPIYNYDLSILNYEESNYRTLSVEAAEFNIFMSNEKISYILNDNLHVISPKAKNKYSVEIDSNNHIGFVKIK